MAQSKEGFSALLLWQHLVGGRQWWYVKETDIKGRVINIHGLDELKPEKGVIMTCVVRADGSATVSSSGMPELYHI